MSNELTAPINFRADQRVTLDMTRDQAAALANTLAWNVDLETVALDNGEPERAAFVQRFVGTVRAGLSPAATDSDQAACTVCKRVDGHRAYCPNQVLTAQQYAELITIMIVADMMAGKIPNDVTDWAQLPAYVDENFYFERAGIPADPTPEVDALAGEIADLVTVALGKRDR